MRYLLTVLLFLYTASVNAALETEPNNDPANADLITFDDPIIGALASYEDLDFFVLTIEEASDVVLRITKLKDDLDSINYAMVDADGVVYAGGSVFSDNYSSKVIGIDTAGLYFIVIGGAGELNTSDGDYEISVQAYAPTGMEETEANDDIETADSLFENRIIFGHLSSNNDIDVFKFEVTELVDGYTNYAQVDIRPLLSDFNDFNYVIFDENGALVAGNILYGEVSALVGLPKAGTYYIAIGGTTEQNTYVAEYEIKVALYYTDLFSVELEPNQTNAQSNYLPMLDVTYGQLYSEEDIDVYKLSIAANSILDLTIQKADDLSFIDFELRNSNGDLISGGELFGANPEEKRIGIGDEGDYFLSIKSSHGINTSNGPYRVFAFYDDLSDEDGDGIASYLDNCFLVANDDQVDTDNDFLGNACDSDDDNDGVADSEDAFPLDASESVDTDNDGIGNNADTDDDGDGYSDSDESSAGTDPLDANSYPETPEEETGGMPIWMYYIVTQSEAPSKSAP